MEDLKNKHKIELIELRAQMLLMERREKELLAILATFNAIKDAEKDQEKD